jgi:MFS family permease
MKSKIPSANLVLVLTTVTSFMTAFMGSSLNIALPVIGSEFEASALILSWLSTIYLLTTAALLLPVGRFSDLKGRIQFYKTGVILFSIGSLLAGLAYSTNILLITRMIQGIGSAFIFSTSTAILISAFPHSQRGKVLGISIASVYAGLSSGPFLGGIITDNWNWRGIFFINAALGLIIIVLIFIKFRGEWEEKLNEKYDYKGAFIYIHSIIFIMTGLSLIPSAAGIIILFSGVALIIFFYLAETKTSFPILNVNVFRNNQTFTFSNFAALINYSATFAIGFLLSFYLQVVKSLSPQEAGLILVTQPVVMALFSPFAGRLSDKYEPRYVSSAGMAFLSAGLILFIFLSGDTHILLITGNLVFLGFGFALFSSPNVNAIMSSVEKKFYGIASSTLASMRMIGQMLSMGFVIIIFNIFLGDSSISYQNQDDFLLSAKIVFMLFSFLSVTGIYFSFSRGKIHDDKPAELERTE